MPGPLPCPTCGTPLPSGTGGPGPCPKCQPAHPRPLRLPPGRPLIRIPPARPPRQRPWPVVRIAGGIGATFGALAVLARWAAGQAAPPADDWAYQCGRALGAAMWFGLIGLAVGALVRVVLRLGGGRPG
jgi:hypothetical protein